MTILFLFDIIRVPLMVFSDVFFGFFPHLSFFCRDVTLAFCDSVADRKLPARADRPPHLSPPNKHCFRIGFQLPI
jgi:hypothetical protein